MNMNGEVEKLLYKRLLKFFNLTIHIHSINIFRITFQPHHSYSLQNLYLYRA